MSIPDPLTPLPVSRNPDTVFVTTLLLVAGIGLLVAGVEPGSVQDLVPGWVAKVWAVIMSIAAALTLSGAMWPRYVSGLLIEGVGRVMLGPASLAYAVAIGRAAGIEGGISMGLLVALALSSAWRVYQIIQEIRRRIRLIDRLSEEVDQP